MQEQFEFNAPKSYNFLSEARQRNPNDNDQGEESKKEP
jgi:hypothetical protein